MNDHELLEMAAKAAGLTYVDYAGVGYDGRSGLMLTDEIGRQTVTWNPLTDDGDAMRLAIKMGVNLSLPSSPNHVFVQVGERGSVPFALDRIGGNPLSATRRAIVRAAAEMGRGKP